MNLRPSRLRDMDAEIRAAIAQEIHAEIAQETIRLATELIASCGEPQRKPRVPRARRGGD